MIRNIHIDNFKLFKKDIDIPLSQINLLTGINGRGKSTVLQVLLLLNQSILENRATNKVLLNGINVKLGSFDDVKNKEVTFSDAVHFGFTFDTFVIDYYLHNQQTNATELNINTIKSNGAIEEKEFEFVLTRQDDLFELTKQKSVGEGHEFTSPLFNLFLSETSLVQFYENWDLEYVRDHINFEKIHYVSADRIGPRNYYEYNSLGQFLSVGALGENTVNLLYQKGGDSVDKKLLEGYSRIYGIPIEDLSVTIEDNVNYWIKEIFQGAKVSVEAIKGEDLLKLRINSDSSATYFKPTNVGYGFSYSLPIIVAGLVAKPGEILIVENPEAHLHPFAQSVLAKFLSLISEIGVQVFIESHSDHILNGLRVCVKDSIIETNQLSVLYFDNRYEDLFEVIKINDDGGIDNWPPNFFDQTANDLNYLYGIE